MSAVATQTCMEGLVTGEECYLDLVKDILENGEIREGRNGKTLSVFSRRLEFDVRKNGFPLLTTKRVFWRGVVEELLWFLRGSTDTHELSDKGIHIWDGNSTREFLDSVGLHDIATGFIGAGYGHQIRNFSGEYGEEVNTGADQLYHIVSELTNNPHGRRAVLSMWNAKQLHRAALPPCHMLYQFYIGKNGLSCQMTQRSADVAAGLPFNIASTSLFTSILAYLLDVQVDRIIITIGDAHIYEQHIENIKIQITRSPFSFPELVINKPRPESQKTDDKIEWIEQLTFNDFELVGYNPHPALKYEMIA
jgi:thymidylate synthase